MLFTDWAAFVRQNTNTDSTTFTDTEMLLDMNVARVELGMRIIKEAGEDIFGLKFTRDLLANVREYKLPSELKKIKFIQVDFGSGYKVLKETDLISYGGAISEEEILSHFNDEQPCYDIFANNIYILNGSPIVNVTNGLYLWAIVLPAKFTSLTADRDLATPPDEYSLGFPEEFQELLARRVQIMYKTSGDRNLTLNDSELKYESDLKTTMNNVRLLNLARSSVSKVRSKSDGSEY